MPPPSYPPPPRAADPKPRHEPVRALQTAFLVTHWSTLKADPALEAKLHEMARGERPYAAALVMHLFRAVAAADCRGPSEREPEAKGAVRWHGPCDEDEDSEPFPIPLRTRKGKDSESTAGEKRKR